MDQHVTLSPAPAAGPAPGGSLRRRAAVGVVTLVGRSLVARVIGLTVFAWYAAHLPEAEFGRLSVGVASTAVFGIASTAAIGVSLIRGSQEPTPDQYGHLMATQLVLGLVVVLAVTSGVWVFTSLDPLLTLLVVSGNPVTALVAPLLVHCERHLNFRPIGISDAAEALVFAGMAFAIGLIWQISVWGLAICYFVRPFVSNVVLIRFVQNPPSRRFVWSLRGSRALLTSGGAISGTSLITVGIDWALITMIVRGAGTAAAGTWSVVDRLSLVPRLAVGSLQQVSLPTISRLDTSRRQAADRLGSLFTLIIAVPGTFALLAAFPVLDAVFGSKYRRAADLLDIFLMLIITAGAFTLSLTTLMVARGRSRAALYIRCVDGTVLLVTTAWLIGSRGVDAVGIGLSVGAVASVIVTLQQYRRVYDRLPHRSSRALAVAVLMAGAAHVLAHWMSGPLQMLGGVLLLVVAWGAWGKLLHPDEWSDALGRVRLMLTSRSAHLR